MRKSNPPQSVPARSHAWPTILAVLLAVFVAAAALLRAQEPASIKDPAELRAYDCVRLRRDVHAGGANFPAGTRGVIVHYHDDHSGYEVECDAPVFRVLTLTAHDLIQDHA